MKRILSLLIILCLVSGFSACSDSDYDTPPEGFEDNPSDTVSDNTGAADEYDIPVIKGLEYDYDLSEYITLPDYKNEDFLFDRLPTDEKSIQSDIEYLRMYSTSASLTDVERQAQKGDVVVFDYTANDEYGEPKISGTDISLILGNEMFAPGFDSYIEGGKKGESLSFNFTFPEGWTNVAGLETKTLVFSVTIKNVQEAKLPELSVVLDEQEVENEEELRLLLIQNRNNTNSYNLFKAIVEQSTVNKYPEKEFDIYKQQFRENEEARAQATGTTLEALIQNEYKASEAVFEEAALSYAKEECKNDLAAHYLQHIYGFELTKENYNLALVDYFETNGSSMGLKSVEEAHENMGQAIADSLFTDLAAQAAYNDK